MGKSKKDSKRQVKPAGVGGGSKAKARAKAKAPEAMPLSDASHAPAALGTAIPPPGQRVSKSDYNDLLEPMQIELNNVARWLQHTGRRLVVVVEGRDTAGKGGVISAISESLSPRQCHVVALSKPSDRERGQWYFQRYVEHLPAPGEMVLFDRSWYNRAGVEPVMGYCTDAETADFLQQAPQFERLLVDDGVLLFKYWLTVDQAEQEQRFAERLADPLKRWKLSPVDVASRSRYADYGHARDRMLDATHTPWAPWTLVDFNDQRRGRLAMIRHLLDHLPDVRVPPAPLDLPPLKTALLTDKPRKRFKPL